MRDKSTFPKLSNKAILSPMSGVTDVAFRTLARKYGAALTYTEFVSGTALVRGSQRTSVMLETDPVEKPVGVQLFGSSYDDVAEAARQVEDKFDIIDINCGCPAWKVIKTGAGSELLKKPEGISRLVSKVAGAISKPVTIKIRSGIDEKHINAVEVAKLAEDAGAGAVTVHGRTQKQAYKGTSDWELIKKVKDSVNIPVIGNGDVTSPEIFEKRIGESGVDYIMIARAAMGNPGLFRQINDYTKSCTYSIIPRLEQFEEYLRLVDKYKVQFASIKTHAMSFTKELRGGARLRSSIAQSKSVEEIKKLMDDFTHQ